jgi:UDP-GlcNAc:undecaprenyl-phosphate/decaprenyl-phosphate GlcNAc-1-phosphate transferase
MFLRMTVIAFVAAACTTPAAAWLGRRYAIVDRPDGSPLKVHDRIVPLTGGLAVVSCALLVPSFGGFRLPASVVVAIIGVLLMGTLDDVADLPPWVRILGLGAAGWIMGGAVGGLEWRVVTSALVVVTANGVNLVDGQDGLAGSMGLIAAIGLALGLSSANAIFPAAQAASLAGSLAGFLVWNLPPAKIFLGNGGAYAVGSMLAFAAACLVRAVGVQGWVAAGLCLAPFAFDTVFTMIRRSSRGTSILRGDRAHTYDLLASRIGRTRTLAAFSLAAAACSVAGVACARGTPVSAGMWAGMSVGIASLFTVALLRVSQERKA